MNEISWRLATLVVRQFVSPVVALLTAAMTVSFVFGEWQQAIAIVVVLLVKAAIGYDTERRAVRSMEALRALGGRNARRAHSSVLGVDESALTGESAPVAKRTTWNTWHPKMLHDNVSLPGSTQSRSLI
jgi:magnesium-transporting ATPase (P-type)